MSDTELSIDTSELGKKIVLTVLRENLDKLAILKCINGWSEDDQTEVTYMTIEEQCQIVKNDDVLPPASKDSVDLLDFRRDCSFIESSIQKTYDEIRQNGTYECLKDLTKIFQRLQQEEADLLEETRRKEETFMELQSKYYEEGESYKNKIENMMVKIGNIKDEIKDFEIEAEMKKNVISNWENSKLEMKAYDLCTKETNLKNQITEMQDKTINEHRVNREIQNIFNEMILDIQKDFKSWKIRYETDMDALNMKFNALQESRNRQQDLMADMIRIYIKRQQEIDDYEIHKIDMEKQRIETARRNEAATIIQAWWRGTMVRRGLGKYKKKKEKKPKGQSDGKVKAKVKK